MSGTASVVTVAAAVGAGTVGGVFFAFSGFVMPALDRLSAAQATTAMQSTNVMAVRPPLMIALFGTAALAVAAPVLAWRGGQGAAAWSSWSAAWTSRNHLRTAAALAATATYALVLLRTARS